MAGTIEKFLVSVVVAADLVIAHLHRGIGYPLRLESDERNFSTVVTVLPPSPELRVGDIDVARDLIEELLFGDLCPIVLLELQENPLLLRQWALQKALILCGIELAIGLEI